MGGKLGAVAMALAALVLGVLAYLRDLSHSGLPWRSGDLPLAGLAGPVEIRFDDYGVPHVRAEHALDLARALGFLHANDRMTQMELGRRAAAGRLSEVLGEGLVNFDVRMRRLGVARAAAEGVARASDRSRAWLEAYAAGVNAWLERRGDDLPPGLRLLGLRPEPWSPVDSAAYPILMAYDLGEPARTELRRSQWLAAVGVPRLAELMGVDELHVPEELLRALEQLPDPTSDEQADGARGNSNNWALTGAHTATGGPLLAGDPHLTVGLPSRFFAARLSAPDFEVFALTLPGTPAPVIGVGEHRAWSLTNTGLDGDDVFLERVDEGGGRVARPGGWLELESHTEEIHVRFGETRQITVARSDLGPFFPGDSTAQGLDRLARSVAWTALEAADPLRLFLALVEAPALEVALEAADTYVAPAQNLLVAQADGRMALQVIGRVPQRRAGDGRLPAPAWSGEYGWRNYEGRLDEGGLLHVSPSSNPRQIDPESGRLFSANADIRPPGYVGEFYADWAPPQRQRRIESALSSREGWNTDDLAALQLDVTSLFGLELAAALAADDLSGDATLARDALSQWDGQVGARGPGALFVLVLRELMAAIMADEWEQGGAPAPTGRGPEYTLVRLLSGELDPIWFDDRRTPEVEGRAQVVQAALASAWASGAARFGPDVADWRLDQIQSLTLEHPLAAFPGLSGSLNRGPIPLPGHSSTVAAIWAHWEADALVVTGTAALRFVADPAHPAGSRHSQPGGQSGHPFDPHYADQIDAWRTATGIPVPWEAPEVSERRILRLR
ncbi:penicillin acylase family protein [Engelhardtia mirabilis]|uniref:Acyl-homoserine lactone acylase QuiP n=1 Tax=Engelhardtia mirabilis TaxID=2528011 RepID=A0A518BLI6_9BACT|nr:Acyl-homoserine lactone acylase QuiP precursor [Planctomycetes bacterium Pla133]QDV02151.1 Acyl-homoserine lactone acylase QuiP precursor [Planctomycetes bacterium Pla86]